MRTRRFNSLFLLIVGVVFLAIGALGVAVGEAPKTTTWFMMGAALLVGAIVLFRMRLP